MGVFAEGLCCGDWESDLEVANVGEGPGSYRCRRGTSGRVWTQRETLQLQMSERDLGSSMDSGKARGFLLGLAMGQLVRRVCRSLETLLMRWDTCHDLDEGQNLTATYNYNLTL